MVLLQFKLFIQFYLSANTYRYSLQTPHPAAADFPVMNIPWMWLSPATPSESTGSYSPLVIWASAQ